MDNEEMYISIPVSHFGSMNLGAALADRAQDALVALAKKDAAAYEVADAMSLLFCNMTFSCLCDGFKDEKEGNKNEE